MKPGLGQSPSQYLSDRIWKSCGYWRWHHRSALVTYVAPHISTPKSFWIRAAVRTCARHGHHSIPYTRATAAVFVVAEKLDSLGSFKYEKPPRPRESS